MLLQRRSKRLALLLGASTLAWATSSGAQGLALGRFDPAPAGDAMFGVPSPGVAPHGAPRLMLLGDYAHDPLVLRRASDGSAAGAVVGAQLLVHFGASLSLFDRLGLDLALPVALHQSGDSPASGGVALSSPSGADVGDLRAGARVRLLGDPRGALQLAVAGYVWLPTGEGGGFVGGGRARGMPQVIVGGRADRVVWSAAAGPEIRSLQRYAGVAQGTMVRASAGLGVLLGASRRVQVGPEVSVALSTESLERSTTNAEALLGGRYRVLRDLEIGAGVGPGLTSGLGTPSFRGVVMVAYAPEPRSRRDAERSDKGLGAGAGGYARPTEIATGGVVPVEAERAEPESPPPADRDGDGVPDEVDACPDLAGVASEDPATSGCPPDTDGDGIRDDLDACPGEPGEAHPDPTKHGCPGAPPVPKAGGAGAAHGDG